jgi:hypothetical protein
MGRGRIPISVKVRFSIIVKGRIGSHVQQGKMGQQEKGSG